MSALLLIEHPVGARPFSDFEAWKHAFDSDPVDRGGHAVRRHWIYASPERDYVVVGLEFETRDEAEHFRSVLTEQLSGIWELLGAEEPVRLLEHVETIEY